MKAPSNVIFQSGDVLRSRSVSLGVQATVLDVPALPARLLADCEREVASQLMLEPGDVEPMSLPRARTRWPDYRLCAQTMADWLRTLGLAEVLASSEMALMACRGARYHHDAEHYGGAVFCNLFVSEDKGLDVHFPGTGQRLPLVRGTALVFDTAQPHAVIRRDSEGFDAAHFAEGIDCTQLFLTWELPVEDATVQRAMGIELIAAPQA